MRKLILLLLLAVPVLAQNHAHMISGINAQSGTSYTVVTADVTKLITFSNVSAVAVTLPAGSTDGFGVGTIFALKNIGPGNVTITPVSGTIDGNSAVLLVTGAGIEIRSDGSNYTSAGVTGTSGGGNAVSLNVFGKGTGPGLPLVDSQCSDDSLNPVRCTHGFNAATGGISFEMPNASVTGTIANRLVCNNGSNQAVVCADNVTEGILGTAQSGAGTTGNVVVCSLIVCNNDFDNQSVVNDFSIAAAAGKLHDIGGIVPTSNNTNFLVLSANAGANTPGLVRPPGDLTGSVSMGMTNPMTTLGDIIYGVAAGAPTRLPGATTLNGVPQNYVSTAAAGVATAPTLAPGGVVPRIVSGTSDTILFTDRNKFIQYTNASPIAVTVPQAGTTGFANNFFFCAENRGAGLVTFTPTTSTVNGVATYTLPAGASGCFVSDNANYITKDSSGASLPGIFYSPTGIGSFGGSPISFLFLEHNNVTFPLVVENDAAPSWAGIGLLENSGGSGFITFGVSSGVLNVDAIQFFDAAVGSHPVRSLVFGDDFSHTTAFGDVSIDAPHFVPYVDNTNTDLGTSSFRWKSLHIGTGASQFDGTVKLPALITTNLLLNATAPTISSGFGTSPTVVSPNGTATFRINVGTGGTATAGVIGLPTAATNWNCSVGNLTAHAGHRADDTVMTASTSTTVTIENQTKTTGAAVAWTASDIVVLLCGGE